MPYDPSKTFAYNANMLCYEELKMLVEKQALGQCNNQLSESVKKCEHDDWTEYTG